MSKKSDKSQAQNDNVSTTPPVELDWMRPDGASAFLVRDSKKVFLSAMTDAYPSSNYRDKSEGNHTLHQGLQVGDVFHFIIGSPALRNGLREGLAEEVGHKKINRRRVHNQGQPTVEYGAKLGMTKAFDSPIFGWLAAKNSEWYINQGMQPFFRSTLCMNHALSLSPYKDERSLTQTANVQGNDDETNKNATHSSLLDVDVLFTAYQYVLAFDTYLFQDEYQEAALGLFRALCQFSNVAGNHARTLFDMTPASLMGRVTKARTAQFDTYAWTEKGENPEIARINEDDLLAHSSASEWYVGGEVVRRMPAEERERLAKLGVNLFVSPQKCIMAMIEAAVPALVVQKAA